MTISPLLHASNNRQVGTYRLQLNAMQEWGLAMEYGRDA